jgi:acetyltransferase-like isoleucine patch superfamily enzyme
MRELIKAGGRAVALVLVAPLVVLYWTQAALIGRDRALEHATELLALFPGLTGRYLRRTFLACVLARCHRTASIGFGTVFSKAGATVEANAYIGPRCHLGLVHVERDALLAAGVHVLSGTSQHGSDDLTRPVRDQEGTVTPVRIGAGAWIGSSAVVMADVGRDTIVGAGAVVVEALPDGVVAAGVPARVLRRRDQPRSAKKPKQQAQASQNGGCGSASCQGLGSL